jgi:hypothetical protein
MNDSPFFDVVVEVTERQWNWLHFGAVDIISGLFTVDLEKLAGGLTRLRHGFMQCYGFSCSFHGVGVLADLPQLLFDAKK